MGFVNTTHDFLLTQSYLLTAARTLPCVATVTLPHRTKTSQKGDDNDLCRRMDDKTDSAKMTFEAIGVAEVRSNSRLRLELGTQSSWRVIGN